MRATRLGAVLAAALTATLTIGAVRLERARRRFRGGGDEPGGPPGPGQAHLLDLGPEHGQDRRGLEQGPPRHPGHRQQAGGRRRRGGQVPHRGQGRQRRPTWSRPSTSTLPSFVAADAVADIKAETAAIKGEFGEGVWGLVTLGTDAVYAVPQDSGPMMLFYRADLFDKHGLQVPKTWDEYADSRPHRAREGPQGATWAPSPARTPAGSPGWPSRPARSGGRSAATSWKVNVDDDAHQEGRRLLGRPGEGGRHRRPAVLHPRVEQGAQRRQAADLAVAPSGRRACCPATRPRPRASGPSPRCRSGTPARTSAASGAAPRSRSPPRRRTRPPPPSSPPGSTPTRRRSTCWSRRRPSTRPPPRRSRRSARRLTTSPTSPTSGSRRPTVSAGARGFTFGPNVNVTYNAYKDAFDKALQDGTSFSDAVQAMHEATVADMSKSGFTLAS